MEPILARPHNWLLHRILQQEVTFVLPRLKGVCVDVGCGVKPYAALIRPRCTSYIGIDHPGTLHGDENIDIFANAMSLPLKNETADSAVALQVMEHIEEPLVLLKEIYRILKDGSYLVVTTPFMWGIHEQPRDFFRYTEYGLRYLLQKAGFEVESIRANTGFWITSGLRLNYYLSRFQRKWNKFIFIPIYALVQVLVYHLDRLDKVERETASYTSIARKAEKAT